MWLSLVGIFNKKNLWVVLVSLVAASILYIVGYSDGKDATIKKYQETVIVDLKKEAQEQQRKKDETITYLLNERNTLRASLDESIGRLQSVTDRDTTKRANNSTLSAQGKSLERCRKFNLEGARLLREAVEGYRGESDRVNALNHIIGSEVK